MDYHLNQQGQTVGIFPLEELCRRRKAGELTGTELVWCQGMAQWQALDTVLQREMPGNGPAPPPLSKPESNLIPTLMMAGVVLGGVVVLVMFGYVMLYGAHGLSPFFPRELSSMKQPRRASAFAEASKPIRWTTNTLTAAQVMVKQREFRIRQYLDGYEKCSEHKPAYDADALQMIKTWIDTNYGGPLQTNNAVVVEMCDKLAANPACNDPLVLTLTGANEVAMQEAVRRLERALKGYEHSHYLAYPRLYATVTLATKVVDLHRDSHRIRELDDSAKQLLKEALEDGSIQPEDQAEIADVLLTGWGSGFAERNGTALLPIVEAAGDRFQWLALMLEGEHQVNAAWKARGGGYRNTVTAEGWKGFSDHLARARASFTKAWGLRPDLPLAACRMIYVSLGDSDIHEMRLWFDRTVALQIDYPGAWGNLRWGLRPRWYGDRDSMLALGITAVNTHRFDTDVPRKLYDSLPEVEEEFELPPGQHIYGREDVWPHLQEMFEGYIAEPSRARERDSWRRSYSVAAYFAGKYDVARTQLEILNWQLDPRSSKGWGRDLSLLPLEVDARTGGSRQKVAAAESASRDGALAEASRIYTELSAAPITDERTQSFVRERLTTLAMEQSLQKGGWIDFLPKGADLPGWAVERGHFTVQPDGALEVNADKGGHIVFSRARVGNEFEVRGTFEVVQSSSASFQAGLVVGLPQFESYAWYSFRMTRNPYEGDVASVASGWSSRQISRPAKLNNGTNTFSFRLQHGLVSATVNDVEIFSDVKPPETRGVPTKEMLVGLGAFNDMNDTVIRYRNMQIRKL